MTELPTQDEYDAMVEDVAHTLVRDEPDAAEGIADPSPAERHVETVFEIVPEGWQETPCVLLLPEYAGADHHTEFLTGPQNYETGVDMIADYALECLLTDVSLKAASFRRAGVY